MKQENDFIKKHCYKAMQVESFSKGNVVFNYGDKGELFYIIFTGSVGVLIPFDVTKNFVHKELIDYVVENSEYIEKNRDNTEEGEVLN